MRVLHRDALLLDDGRLSPPDAALDPTASCLNVRIVVGRYSGVATAGCGGLLRQRVADRRHNDLCRRGRRGEFFVALKRQRVRRRPVSLGVGVSGAL